MLPHDSTSPANPNTLPLSAPPRERELWLTCRCACHSALLAAQLCSSEHLAEHLVRPLRLTPHSAQSHSWHTHTEACRVPDITPVSYISLPYNSHLHYLRPLSALCTILCSYQEANAKPNSIDQCCLLMYGVKPGFSPLKLGNFKAEGVVQRLAAFRQGHKHPANNRSTPSTRNCLKGAGNQQRSSAIKPVHQHLRLQPDLFRISQTDQSLAVSRDPLCLHGSSLTLDSPAERHTYRMARLYLGKLAKPTSLAVHHGSIWSAEDDLPLNAKSSRCSYPTFSSV